MLKVLRQQRGGSWPMSTSWFDQKRWLAASDRLCKAGWAGKHGESSDIWSMKRSAPQHQIIGEGEFGEIDLHRQVFHFSRRDHALDVDLWKNSRAAHLFGRPVLIPSVADSIVISIAHGVRSGDGDWAIDVDYRIRTSQIEWDTVAYIADQRGLVPFILAGLAYLKILGSNIPPSVLDVFS